MYQDNFSTMILEKTGQKPNAQWKKYIWVRYFLVKDWIMVGDVTLECFPMGNMLGYHFTKPLQESLFSKFRAEIQGIPDGAWELDMFWGEYDEPVVLIPQECIRRDGKYMGTIPLSNGWGILRIHSGTDGDWTDILNKIYRVNSYRKELPTNYQEPQTINKLCQRSFSSGDETVVV